MNEFSAARRPDYGDSANTRADTRSGGDSSTTSRPSGISAGWLRAIRGLWLALALLALGLFAASLPAYYTQVQRPCTDATTCNLTGALTAQALAQLPAMGLSVGSYAMLLTIFFAAIVVIWSGIGFVIFLRRPNDWFALFSALFLVLFNSTYPGFPITALAIAHPSLTLLISSMGALGVFSIIVFLVLFPNGRLAPRWMGLILLLGVFGSITTAFPNLQISNGGPAWLDSLINIPQYLAIVGAQIYRYRKVSTPVEQQQTKWVVFGIIVVMLGISLPSPIFSLLIPGFNQSNTLLTTVLGLVNYPIVLLALPITVSIALLRSRLYDIDIIIRRTLLYGSLTLLLALLYVGMIIGLEGVVRLFTTSDITRSPIVITLSTLAIATLVLPLRNRLQSLIDRRFYRRKYDAARTLASFGATQRNEVDLNELARHLLTVVQETMQPAHVSLWLRPTPPAVHQPFDGEQDRRGI